MWHGHFDGEPNFDETEIFYKANINCDNYF